MLTLKEYRFQTSESIFHCELTTSELDGLESMSYTTYGVRIVMEDGEVVLLREDISTDMQFVEDYIEICRTNDIASVHMEDILYDLME